MDFKKYFNKLNNIIANHFGEKLTDSFQERYSEIDFPNDTKNLFKSSMSTEGLAMFDLTIKTLNECKIIIPAFEKKLVLFLFCNDGDLQFNSAAKKIETYTLNKSEYGVFAINHPTDMELSVTPNKFTAINIVIACPEIIARATPQEGDSNLTLIEKQQLDGDLIALECIHHGKHNLKLERLVSQLEIQYKSSYLDYLSRIGIMYGLFCEHLELCLSLTELGTDENNKISWNTRMVAEKARIIIHSDIANYTTVKKLAEQCNANITSLQRGFKVCYGVTVNQYVQNLRMDRAVEMLVDSHLHISEIVYNLGLVNRSYFTKLFKSYHQCTPSDFRKKYVEEIL